VRKLLIVGIALAIIGIVVMLVPFRRPDPQPKSAVGAYVMRTSRCSAPIVSAWHRDADAGWFGYAPLTSVPGDVAFPACKPRARRRLAGGMLFVACGAAVGIVAIRRRPRTTPDVPPDALA
jgi:hypothetical protein